jgi:hypothetical protein
MKCLPTILASGAVIAILLCSAVGLAQVERVRVRELEFSPDGRIMVERQPRAAVPRQRLRSTSNQLRPYYRYELMHIRAACGLTREQLREIRPETDVAYEDAIERIIADGQGGPRPREGSEVDYLGVIHEVVWGVVKGHLTLSQRAAYEEDLRLRHTSRKEAGVDLLVAVIDRELLLTERQRHEIGASIAAHWDDQWCDAAEAAFSHRSRRPGLSDPLVTPYLSTAQQATWHQMPRFEGRLWGVTIDHGGGPAMEQDLGADARGGRPVALPYLVAAVVDGRHAIEQEPAAPPPVVRRRIAVDDLVRFEPAQDEDEDPEADPDADPAVLRQRQLELRLKMQAEANRQAYLRRFDQLAFGGGLTEDSLRLPVESIMAKQLDHIERASGLTEAQKRKLHAAGQGDLKRFLDRVSEARRGLRANDDPRALILEIRKSAQSFTEDRTSLLAAKGPIFTRAFAHTLTDDQRAAFEKDGRDRRAFRHRADVRWTAVLLARSLGLLDDQRRRLEAVLLKGTRPPLKFDTLDYTLVMYQASRIPEDEIRPIFDDLQWRVMTQELAASRRYKLPLKNGGFLPEEMFDDREDGTLPPIHLLDPPATRSR